MVTPTPAERSRPHPVGPESVVAVDPEAVDPEAGDPRGRQRLWPVGLRGRLLEGLVVAVVWTGLGLVLSLDVVTSLLVGVLLLVTLQLVRRRPLRRLWARDNRTFATTWPGKAAVAATLLAILAALMAQYVPTWVDDSWIVLLMLVGLLVGYLGLRRLLVAVTLAAVLTTGALWIQSPRLAEDWSGDPSLLAEVGQLRDRGMLDGLHNLAIAEVDLNAPQPVRLVDIGATDNTPMEIGSMTKALTGLIIADSVSRGELELDAPVSTYLPQLRGSEPGQVTIRELVTHQSGYAAFGADTYRRAVWSAPIGRNWINTPSGQMMHEARQGELATRGSYAYSTLGAAIAGQAAAAAAGMTYPDLMQTRLFGPLKMTSTAIQTGPVLVAGGHTASGLSVQPWVMDAYAPGGAGVSTAHDLTLLATAILDGSAPGMEAVTPTAASDQSNTRMGDFWRISHWQIGKTITWHNGQTAGYTSYLGLDREHRQAVIVLSDVAADDPGTTDLGIQLLAQAK